MFRGRKHLTLDAKGRMAMPAKFRDQMLEAGGGKMVITIDRSKCLLIYALPDWELVEEKLSRLSSTKEAVRRFTRFLLHNAEDTELDGQGRFLIPPGLREYANLQKKVVVAGHGSKLELWDEERYTQEQEALVWPSDEDLGEDLADFSM